jgi:hypothetical protein
MEILTTLPHYAAAVPVIRIPVYASTIMIGTSVSILYHVYPDSWTFATLNYIGAVTWFLMDMIYSSQDESVFYRVLIMNVFIFGWWAALPPDFHAFWHLLSAIKCFCISILLQRLDQAQKNKKKLYDGLYS